MTTYFISNHAGAKAWAEEEGFHIDHLLGHFDPMITQKGDRVLGTLPVHLAAEVCARGGEYYHLSLMIPPELRGTELSVKDMRLCGSRLDPYYIEQEKVEKKL